MFCPFLPTHPCLLLSFCYLFFSLIFFLFHSLIIFFHLTLSCTDLIHAMRSRLTSSPSIFHAIIILLLLPFHNYYWRYYYFINYSYSYYWNCMIEMETNWMNEWIKVLHRKHTAVVLFWIVPIKSRVDFSMEN